MLARVLMFVVFAMLVFFQGVEQVDAQSLIGRVLNPRFALFLLGETTEGIELSIRLINKPVSGAQHLDELARAIEKSGAIRAEIESRIIAVERRFLSEGGRAGRSALSSAERLLLERLAGQELRLTVSAAPGEIRFASSSVKAGYLAAQKRFLLQRGGLSGGADISGQITLGRELSGIIPPRVSPQDVLRAIQVTRGGVIEVHPTIPGKWVLRDAQGKVWGAELDGKFLRRGPFSNVVEIQTPPLLAEEASLVEIPLRALIEVGGEPLYSVGGGHIHIGLDPFLQNPKRFASLMNFLLTYEELLVYLFSNPARNHAIMRLSQLPGPAGTGKSLAAHLGEQLNLAIATGKNERILDTLETFATRTVKTRDVDINLKSWKGSTAKKTHGTLELRFPNAPKLVEEMLLEDQLVRAIARHASRNRSQALRFRQIVDPIVGENAYLDDAKLLEDLRAMLDEVGLDPADYERVFVSRLRERRHPGN